jgi:HEAT repeat protein
MTRNPLLTIEDRINNAIDRLKGLREGQIAILDLVACGQAAVEPLSKFLFAYNPSGIFQPRCEAVQALAALGARDVLVEFLSSPRDVIDPVEQAGENAVTNAVARALIKWPDDQVFSLLLEIPIFAAALGEDFCRPAAEKGFCKIGVSSCPYLLQLAEHRIISADFEYDSSRRRRRSALKLFAEMHHSEDLPETIRSLVTDNDPQVALLACSISLPRLSTAERKKVAVRLIDLLNSNNWMLRSEVEDVLIQYYSECRSIIENSLIQASEPVASSLRRVTSLCNRSAYNNRHHNDYDSHTPSEKCTPRINKQDKTLN